MDERRRGSSHGVSGRGPAGDGVACAIALAGARAASRYGARHGYRYARNDGARGVAFVRRGGRILVEHHRRRVCARADGGHAVPRSAGRDRAGGVGRLARVLRTRSRYPLGGQTQFPGRRVPLDVRAGHLLRWLDHRAGVAAPVNSGGAAVVGLRRARRPIDVLVPVGHAGRTRDGGIHHAQAGQSRGMVDRRALLVCASGSQHQHFPRRREPRAWILPGATGLSRIVFRAGPQ